jgi:hypothetical protein
LSDNLMKMASRPREAIARRDRPGVKRKMNYPDGSRRSRDILR